MCHAQRIFIFSFFVRPRGSITGTTKTSEDTTEIYAVKTNATLFKDYIKNCETVELVIIVEKTHEVIGTAHIGELSNIFTCKPHSQYIPILNNSDNEIGKIHVSLQLTYLTKLPNMQLKMYEYNKEQRSNDVSLLLSATGHLQYDRDMPEISYKNAKENIKKRMKSVKIDTFDTYRSVLKDKRSEFQGSRKTFNETTTDKLIAQIVARAQKLRGVMLNETYNEDTLTLNDSSMSNVSCPNILAENNARLCEYILGKEMTSLEEKQALNTLRSTSPTPSLIDMVSKTITTCKYDDKNARINKSSPIKSNDSSDSFCEETIYNKPKGLQNSSIELEFVDNSFEIYNKSFLCDIF